MPDKRVPVKIEPETHAALKTYSQLTGRTIVSLLAEAVKDWVDIVGKSRLEAIQEGTQQ